MNALPSGTVTFLFTDIEQSTRSWEDHRSAMERALARHDEILRRAVESRGGYVFSTGGDGFGVAFAEVQSAVEAVPDALGTIPSEPRSSAQPEALRPLSAPREDPHG